MTKTQALFVKCWRERQECSWRIVHKLWQMRYVPKKDWWYNEALLKAMFTADTLMEVFGYYRVEEPHGNQREGQKLCYEAMETLNEEWDG